MGLQIGLEIGLIVSKKVVYGVRPSPSLDYRAIVTLMMKDIYTPYELRQDVQQIQQQKNDCGRNNESDLIIVGGNASSSCLVKIMDMRPKTSAMANRTQGYGYENTSNYRGTTIDFYGIGNMHAVR